MQETAATARRRVVPIIEEWTAWLLVRERERELARQDLLRQAEQARVEREAAKLLTLPPQAKPGSERPPRRRRAA